MQNIEQILATIEGLTDEQANAIKSGVNENYRTIAEFETKKSRITELETQLETLNESVAKLQGENAEVAELREQVEQFKADDEKRKEKEAQAEKDAAFAETFDKAVKDGNHEFANSLMRDAILTKVKATCEANPDIKVEDAIESATDGVNGVWSNPQRDIAKMPAGETNANSSDADKEAKRIQEFMFPRK